VRRSEWERNAADGCDAGLLELAVRRLDRRRQDIAAEVRRVVLPPSRRRDHEVIGRRVGVGAGERQLLAERRRQVNLPDALWRLRVDHVQRAGTELYVPPAERECLADRQCASNVRPLPVAASSRAGNCSGSIQGRVGFVVFNLRLLPLAGFDSSKSYP